MANNKKEQKVAQVQLEELSAEKLREDALNEEDPRVRAALVAIADRRAENQNSQRPQLR